MGLAGTGPPITAACGRCDVSLSWAWQELADRAGAQTALHLSNKLLFHTP